MRFPLIQLQRKYFQPIQSLQKDIYFGRYGIVKKLILNPPFPSKKGIPHQAYVTYENELDAALAIVVQNHLSSPLMDINSQIECLKCPSVQPSIVPIFYEEINVLILNVFICTSSINSVRYLKETIKQSLRSKIIKH